MCWSWWEGSCYQEEALQTGGTTVVAPGNVLCFELKYNPLSLFVEYHSSVPRYTCIQLLGAVCPLFWDSSCLFPTPERDVPKSCFVPNRRWLIKLLLLLHGANAHILRTSLAINVPSPAQPSFINRGNLRRSNKQVDTTNSMHH